MGERLEQERATGTIAEMAQTVEALILITPLKDAKLLNQFFSLGNALGRGEYWRRPPDPRNHILIKEYSEDDFALILRSTRFSQTSSDNRVHTVALMPSNILSRRQTGALVLPESYYYHYQGENKLAAIRKLVWFASEEGKIPLASSHLQNALYQQGGIDNIFGLLAEYCPELIGDVDWYPKSTAIYLFFAPQDYPNHLCVFSSFDWNAELAKLSEQGILPKETPPDLIKSPRSLLAVVNPLPSCLFWLNFPPNSRYSEPAAKIYKRLTKRYCRLYIFQPKRAKITPGQFFGDLFS